MAQTYTTSHLFICSQPFRSHVETHISEHWNVTSSTYPHISWFGDENETLKIETIRSVQEHLSFAHADGSIRFCVLLGIHVATQPAQNALLKLVEEPPPNTQIILVGQTMDTILPTIQSRCKIYLQPEIVEKTQHVELYAELKKASIPDALTLAEQFADRSDALKTTTSLLHFLHDKLTQTGEKEILASDIRTLVTLKKRLECNCNAQLAVEVAFLTIAKH